MIYIRNEIPYKISHQQAINSNAIEKLTIEIPTETNQTFTVSNWYLPPEKSHHLQWTDISFSELQPDIILHEVICADDNAHDFAWDQITNPNARGEYLSSAAMDANCTFFNDPELPTRQDQATGGFSSDVPIVHAALRDTCDLESFDTLSPDHWPILITLHLSTEKLRGGNSRSGIGGRGIWPHLQQQLMNS